MSLTPKRIVIKVGTGVLTREESSTLDEGQFQRIAEAVAELTNAGHECLLVSSGAVGAGLSVMNLREYPQETSVRQACAAVGQIQLLHRYERLFRYHKIEVAQVLLTQHDIDTDDRRQRVLATLSTLLSADRIIPIINENDTVAVEELKMGDNDQLAARLATTIGADLLLLLTTVDGLLDAEQNLIPEVHNLEEASAMVSPEKGRFSMGGMQSKLQAIDLSVSHGVPAIIANGRRLTQISEIVEGTGICTRFPAAP